MCLPLPSFWCQFWIRNELICYKFTFSAEPLLISILCFIALLVLYCMCTDSLTCHPPFIYFWGATPSDVKVLLLGMGTRKDAGDWIKVFLRWAGGKANTLPLSHNSGPFIVFLTLNFLSLYIDVLIQMCL